MSAVLPTQVALPLRRRGVLSARSWSGVFAAVVVITVLVPLLNALHEHPDWLLLSHQDSDHVGGATSLLAERPQMQVLGSIQTDHPLQQIRPIMPCAAGQVSSYASRCCFRRLARIIAAGCASGLSKRRLARTVSAPTG